MPFETTYVSTKFETMNGSRKELTSRDVADYTAEIQNVYEQVAKNGGKIVSHNMVKLRDNNGQNDQEYAIIVSEFPEK